MGLHLAFRRSPAPARSPCPDHPASIVLARSSWPVRDGGPFRLVPPRPYAAASASVGLPGLHGDEVCRQVVRERLLTRVLMLTASGTVRDRVEGLGLGADDYLTKPFAYDELLARVLALGRRARPALPPVLERAGIAVDTARRSATRDGHRLALSRKEFAVLEALLRAEGAVVGNDDLIEQVWEQDTSYSTNAVRVTVSKLRAKLGEPPLIETVPGSGYRIAAS